MTKTMERSGNETRFLVNGEVKLLIRETARGYWVVPAGEKAEVWCKRRNDAFVVAYATLEGVATSWADKGWKKS